MSGKFSEIVSVYGPKLRAEFGLTSVQVAGILGNLAHESGLFVRLQQMGCRPPNGGYGWAQWTAIRRRTFEGYCRAHRLAPSSDEANYGYLCVDLHGAYRGVISALKRCANVDSAAETFERKFEVAGQPMMSSRKALARQALAILEPHHPQAVAAAPHHVPRVARKPHADKHRVGRVGKHHHG